ncbi:DUF2239 family protein [Microbulbifer variabilis]|uniref:DUF2239 family protein n=1 Tax=Microbulbifer variabilis TaxID=266805 RepID=UPI001CFF1EE9|nr:DUF2239 family protein [Microbulbifer variabilis]
MASEYLAIDRQQVIAQGTLETVVRQVKSLESQLEPMVFSADNCKRVEIDWQGDFETVLARLKPDTAPSNTKRGRPKLGVISKEVTLLPRHWEWLKQQPGGASVTLRKLVEQAQKQVSIEERISTQQQQLDRFMLQVVGDAPGFEDASRALYRNSKVSFEKAVSGWPDKIKHFVLVKFNNIAEMHKGNQ